MTHHPSRSFEISEMLGTPSHLLLLPLHSSLFPKHLLTDVHGTNTFSSEPAADGKRRHVIAEGLESSGSLAYDLISAEHMMGAKPCLTSLAFIS